MDSALKGLLSAHEVLAAFIAWLATNGLVTTEHLARAASNEDKVDDKLINARHGIDLEMIDEIRIKSAWAAARRLLDTPAPCSTLAVASAPALDTFSEGVEEGLVKDWYEKHAFNLPGTRLVSTKLMVRLWRGLQRDRKQLELISLDVIRTKSDILIHEVKGTAISGSSVWEIAADILPDDTRPSLLFKIWAYLTSLCYLTVTDASFYDFETHIAFVDQLETLILLRVDRGQPTLRAVSGAWMMMLTEFATEVQNHRVTLTSLVKDRGSWTHFWRDMELERGGPAAATKSSSSSAGADLSTAHLPHDVSASMKNTNKLVEQLRSQVDRLRSTKSPGDGRGKGGKGGKEAKVKPAAWQPTTAVKAPLSKKQKRRGGGANQS